MLTELKLKTLHQLEDLAIFLDKSCKEGDIDEGKADKAQQLLNKATGLLIEDPSNVNPRCYVLYEDQAILYWINGKKDKAIELSLIARKVKGDGNLLTESGVNLLSMTKNQPASVSISKDETKLIGVGGWLAFFVISLAISTIWTLYNFFKDGIGLSFSDIADINAYKEGLGDIFSSFIAFENIALVIYVALLVCTLIFILRKKRLAKHIAIVTLAYCAVYSLVDYLVAYRIFSDAGLSSYLSEYSNTISRGVIYAAVWIPYMCASNRVKLTLTK